MVTRFGVDRRGLRRRGRSPRLRSQMGTSRAVNGAARAVVVERTLTCECRRVPSPSGVPQESNHSSCTLTDWSDRSRECRLVASASGATLAAQIVVRARTNAIHLRVAARDPERGIAAGPARTSIHAGSPLRIGHLCPDPEPLPRAFAPLCWVLSDAGTGVAAQPESV
jgi:hypothetical protein